MIVQSPREAFLEVPRLSLCLYVDCAIVEHARLSPSSDNHSRRFEGTRGSSCILAMYGDKVQSFTQALARLEAVLSSTVTIFPPSLSLLRHSRRELGLESRSTRRSTYPLPYTDGEYFASVCLLLFIFLLIDHNGRRSTINSSTPQTEHVQFISPARREFFISDVHLLPLCSFITLIYGYVSPRREVVPLPFMSKARVQRCS